MLLLPEPNDDPFDETTNTLCSASETKKCPSLATAISRMSEVALERKREKVECPLFPRVDSESISPGFLKVRPPKPGTKWIKRFSQVTDG
jgi:hypothetical protein